MVAGNPARALIFDATVATFLADVVERSRSVTIAVDFWAPWCGPCRALAPLLEQLVTHYAGGLAVARVNTDEEPAIASQFGIRSIPDVRIFRDGRMVDGFVGVQPLDRLRALFDRYVSSQSAEPPRDAVRDLIAAGQLDEAIAQLEARVQAEPGNAAAQLDLADALARRGDLQRAEETLERLPASAATGRAVDAVRARIQFMRDAPIAEEAQALAATADAPDAPPSRDQYRLAVHELLRGDPGRGLELLLTLLRRDRKFGDGLAQRALIQAFALLGEGDERVSQYRRRMAALLN